jgi:putative protease
MDFRREGGVVCLAARDEDGNVAELTSDICYEEPKDAATARRQIEKHLSRTGNTLFGIARISISPRIGFLSMSFLNNIRRDVLEELKRSRLENIPRRMIQPAPNSIPYPWKRLDYRANVFNEHARHFYTRHQAEVVEPAYEALPEKTGKEVMKMRYCLRHELDACLRSANPRLRLTEPLQITDGRHRYRVLFDCEACGMSLIYLGTKQP